MRTIRLRCETRAEIDGRVLREYGETARVVAVEEVLSGGIGGFFARRHLDVSVEVPDPDDEPVPAAPAPEGGHAFSSRSGIARLLEDAEADELRTGPGRPDAPVPATFPPLPPVAGVMPTADGGTASPPAALSTPSTAGREFETLLSSLSAGIGAESPPPPAPIPLPFAGDPVPPVPPPASPPPLFRVSSRAPAAPVPLSGPGDLVVVAGFTHDALEAAVLVGRLAGCDQVFDAGTVRGNSRRRVDDKRAAIVARAAGVQSGRAAVVAFGLDPAAGGVDALVELEPDQLWLAVDVSRKVADTDLWVGQVRLRTRIDGIVPTGELFTASPETVDLLGIPVLRGGVVGALPPSRA